MNDSVLDGKRILAVDDEPDVLGILEEEIMDACPNCVFEKAVNYEDAKEMIGSESYDVVILDIMGVRGFDLLDIAVQRGLKAAVLTAHALSPEMLARAVQMKARAYLSKEKLGQIVPFLEDLVSYDYESGLYHVFPDSPGPRQEGEGEGTKRQAGDGRDQLRKPTVSWYGKHS